MPTTNPRLSVTLSVDDLAVLDRFAKASGVARASVISDLVHTIAPQLKEAADLMEMAKAAPRRIKQGLVDDLSNATADAMGMLEGAMSDYRKVMSALQRELVLEPVEGRKGGKRKLTTSAPRRPQNPRPLTGGSNS